MSGKSASLEGLGQGRTQLRLVYLDHNVIDTMTKGDTYGISEFLQQESLTPVFSDENLAEIQRSTGYESRFLEVLERTRARYLVPILDGRFRHTGRVDIKELNAFEAYAAYVENENALPERNFGLGGMLQKFYGGRKDQSFSEIVFLGADEVSQLLEKLQDDMRSVPELSDEEKAEIGRIIAFLGATIKWRARSISEELDAMPGNATAQFEQATGLGSSVLERIQPPEVVRKIWQLVEGKLGGAQIDLETFFGVKPLPFDEDVLRERTTLEKVNAIYHQLNFLGYYRDSRMGRPRRFVASFSDMTHAGLASFCGLLLSMDMDLVKKTLAAYEYLRIDTQVRHLGTR